MGSAVASVCRARLERPRGCSMAQCFAAPLNFVNKSFFDWGPRRARAELWKLWTGSFYLWTILYFNKLFVINNLSILLWLYYYNYGKTLYTTYFYWFFIWKSERLKIIFDNPISSGSLILIDLDVLEPPWNHAMISVYWEARLGDNMLSQEIGVKSLALS